MTLPQKKFGTPLKPGLYAYCGSANGPGGLRSRLSRHISTNKKMHWHVDQLTKVADVNDVAAVIDGCECELVEKVQCTQGATVPLKGFGSSDCRVCTAHLIKVPDRFAFQEIGLNSCFAELERLLSG